MTMNADRPVFVTGVQRSGTTLVGRILPAIQEQAWSLQGEETLDIKFLATEISATSNMLAYVKDQP